MCDLVYYNQLKIIYLSCVKCMMLCYLLLSTVFVPSACFSTSGSSLFSTIRSSRETRGEHWLTFHALKLSKKERKCLHYVTSCTVYGTNCHLHCKVTHGKKLFYGICIGKVSMSSHARQHSHINITEVSLTGFQIRFQGWVSVTHSRGSIPTVSSKSL